MAQSYDYVIIGAGSAGCVLANRLTEDAGVSVLLLEAGGWDRSPYIHLPMAWGRMFGGRMFDWGYDTMPEPHLDNRVLDCARGKVMGGSSSINAMAYGRGHPSDYDGWADQGMEDWAWDEVLPYFRKMETWEKGGNDVRGGDGPIRVREVPVNDRLSDAFFAAARDLQMPFTDDTNGEQQLGWHVPQFSIGRGRRCSTSVAYLRPALKRGNLTVESNALVDRIVVEDGRAVAVDYSVKGTDRQARARREVILSAGSINSPQVLMRSGIGDGEQLAALGVPVVADLPGVGRNLHDHVNVAHDVIRSDSGELHKMLRYDRFFSAVAEALFLRTGPVTGLPMGAIAFLKSRFADKASDLTFLVRQSAAAPSQYWPWQTPGPDGIGYRVVYLQPESRGEIRVVSRDPAAAPEIYQNLLASPRDREVARDAMRLVGQINEHPLIKPFVAEETKIKLATATDDELDAHIRQTTNTVHHPVGTVKMGKADDPMAVLDGRLRVRGVDGLRVVDASIMPVIVTGPTNAPTIMIAERASDLIKSEARGAAGERAA